MITENMQEYRKLDAAEFRSNPYIRNVKVPTAKAGNFTLTTAAYEPGELLEYDLPDFARDPFEHRIGYFTERVEFPGIYVHKNAQKFDVFLLNYPKRLSIIHINTN